MAMHEGEEGTEEEVAMEGEEGTEEEVVPAMTAEEVKALAQQLYIAYYGRPADPGGLTFWTNEFMNSTNLDKALSDFGTSAEYADLSADMTSGELVTSLFQQMFGRDPEKAGLDFYVGRLDGGEATLASIAKQIADGASDEDAPDATTLANKVAVANAFTAAVEEGGDKVVYGGPQIPPAMKLLMKVDGTEASVTSGNKEAMDLVSKFGGDMSFTLTAARDSIDSGYSDDTFTATSTTVQLTDVIEDPSSSDMDVLNISNTGGVLALTVRNVENININQNLFDGYGASNANKVYLSNVIGAKVTVSSEKLGYDGKAMVVGLGDNMLTFGNRVTTVTVGDADDATIDLGMAKMAMICTIATTATGAVAVSAADIAKDKTGPTIVVNGDVTLTVKGSKADQTLDLNDTEYTYGPTYTLRGADDAKVTLTAATKEADAAGDLVPFEVAGTGDMKLMMASANGAEITNSKASGSLLVVSAGTATTDVSKVQSAVTFSGVLDDAAEITAADGQMIVLSMMQTNAITVKGSKATDDLAVTAMATLEGITFSNAASATLTVAGDKAFTISGALTGTVPVSVVSASANVTVTTLSANADFSDVAGMLKINGVGENSNVNVTGGVGKNTVILAENSTAVEFANELGYKGGAGADKIVVANLAATGRIGAELGAGNDTITLHTIVDGGLIEVDGGGGVDTLMLQDAANISAATASIKLKNFEALDIVGSAAKDDADTPATIEGMESLKATVGLSELKDFRIVALADSKTAGGDGADTATITVESDKAAMIDLSHLRVVEPKVSFILEGKNKEADGSADAVTTIIGSSSSDTITGGASAGDMMTGGRGADTFAFAESDSFRAPVSVTKTTLGYDTIMDFMKGVNDKLDLSSLTSVTPASDTADEAKANGESFGTDANAVFAGSTGVTYVIKDGVLSLKGTSAAKGKANTLDEWLLLALDANDDNVDGSVLAFQFNGDTYVHQESGDATINLIKLQGVTGVGSLVDVNNNIDVDLTNDVMVGADAIQIM